MEFDKIFNQNCLHGLKTLPSNSVDLTITSPPYDSLRNYNYSSNWNFGIFKKIATELYRVTKPGGVIVWIVGDMTNKGSESGTSFKQALYFKDLGFLLHDTMIWQKISPFQHKNRYIQCFEYMFVLSKDSPPKTAHLICDRQNIHGGAIISGTQRNPDGTTRILSSAKNNRTIKKFGARYNIWAIPGNMGNKTGHPAVFPVQLIKDHILTWSNPGDLVCDPFIGSGTTAVAAVKSGRHYIGYEIDPEYFQICCNRVSESKIARE